MKRNFALVLTALMLVFSLTACGGRSNNDTAGNNGTADNNGSAATENTNGTNTDRNDSALGGAVDDAVNGMENAVDDVLPGDNNGTQSSEGGVTYGDMLENGTVEDAPTTGGTTNGQNK